MSIKKRKRTPEPTPAEINVDTVLFASQLGASALAFDGDVLVQSSGGELRRWNALTMQRSDAWQLPHSGFCIAQDGTVYAYTSKAAAPALHRIANGAVDSLPLIVPGMGPNVLLPGRTPDQLYLTSGARVYGVRVASGATVEDIAPHPAATAPTRDQWVSRRDGRLICNGGNRLVTLDGKATAEYPTPDRTVLHVAAGSAERVWYSHAPVAEDWNAQTLVLAAVDKPTSDITAISVAPARVVHLASHADSIAALLFTARAPDDLRWSVAIYDETGRARWRADVPEGFAPGRALNGGFVAIGAHRVVLAAPDGKLFAWDAANGKVVG